MPAIALGLRGSSPGVCARAGAATSLSWLVCAVVASQRHPIAAVVLVR
jgi:hypothetical protein